MMYSNWNFLLSTDGFDVPDSPAEFAQVDEPEVQHEMRDVRDLIAGMWI